MDKHKHNGIFTIVVGGAAGDGMREAGNSIGQVLAKLGYEIFISFKYPSLIRGGHNYSRLSFSGEKIFYDHPVADLVIAMNDETVKLHASEMDKDGIVFAESFSEEDEKKFGKNAVAIPFSRFIKETGAPPIARSSVALGAVCYLLDLPLTQMIEILGGVFKEKYAAANIILAKMGYEHLESLDYRHWKKIESSKTGPKELVEGNAALARGLMAAGLDFYVGYPMTPSSSLLHYLAKQESVKTIQPENELAVINMALGIAYGGKRVAIGSATGGFALMQEGFSLAGVAEIPIVVMVSQRQGPATGVPTHSSQADLRFVLHSGHGEFPRIVLAPGDPEEAFRLGAQAMNLAWKYQLPVVVLMDKHASENSATSTLDASSVKIEKGKVIDSAPDDYNRYAVTADGVSPLAFPGTPNAAVKFNSYEHGEDGIVTEEPAVIKKMQEKRFAKSKGIANEMKKSESVKVYGNPKAKNAVIFWGSTKTVVLESAKFLKKPVRFVQPIWMEPLDADALKNALKGAGNIIDVENNHNAQFAGLLKEKTGIDVHNKILRYDSKPFNTVELAGELNKLLK